MSKTNKFSAMPMGAPLNHRQFRERYGMSSPTNVRAIARFLGRWAAGLRIVTSLGFLLAMAAVPVHAQMIPETTFGRFNSTLARSVMDVRAAEASADAFADTSRFFWNTGSPWTEARPEATAQR